MSLRFSLDSVPKSTKALVGTFLGLYAIYQITGMPMSVTPGLQMFLKPWTFLTATFFLPDLLSIGTYDSARRNAVHLWDCRRLLHWCDRHNLHSQINADKLEGVPLNNANNTFRYDIVTISGPMALFGSFAVSIMQQSPDATFLMLPNISISATMLPTVMLTVALLSSLAVQSFVPLILSTGGILSTYWYLRYIRIVDGHKGDRSIGMSFSIMFPPILRPLGELLAEKSYQIVTKYDRWSLLQDTDLEGRPTTRRLSAQEEGRRRQLALQLLNEKMSQKREKEGTPEAPEELAESVTGNPNIPLETGRPMMLQQA